MFLGTRIMCGLHRYNEEFFIMATEVELYKSATWRLWNSYRVSQKRPAVHWSITWKLNFNFSNSNYFLSIRSIIRWDIKVWTENLVLKICKNQPKTGYRFWKIAIIPKVTCTFLLFSSSFILFKSVGTKEITILQSYLVVLTISQRKRHYKVYKSSNMHYKLYL